MKAQIGTEAGTRVEVDTYVGGRPYMQRPLDCRSWCPAGDGTYNSRCKCGTCEPTLVIAEGVYQGTTYWADNSISGQVLLDTGTYVTIDFKAPSGDLC